MTSNSLSPLASQLLIAVRVKSWNVPYPTPACPGIFPKTSLNFGVSFCRESEYFHLALARN